MLQKAPDVAEVLAGEQRRARRSRRNRRILAGLAAAAVLVAGWLWWSGAFSPAAQQFATEPVERGDIRVTVVATGTLEPTGEVSVSSTLAGTITSVDVDYNDVVSRNQILARLDMGDLEARLARAIAMVANQEASRLVAEANLADSRAALDRVDALSAGQSVSVREVELAGTAVKRAEANLIAAGAQLDAAEADLQGVRNDYRKACVCSPIDGVVLEVNVQSGQTMASTSLGQAMFVIAEDLSVLNLEVDIDEADIGRVSDGDQASFTVEAWPDRIFEGEIRQIRYAPSSVDGVVSYRAVLRVDNANGDLRPGMTATAEIDVDTVAGVLTVPNASLRFTPATATPALANGIMPTSSIEAPAAGQRSVWILRDDEPQEVAVTTGLSDGQRTEITGGALEPGDAVIVGIASP